MQQPVYGVPVFIAGDYPVQCTCPHCKQTVVTRIEKQSGLLTWLLIGILLLIGCWLGCCLIPLCVDGCKVRHTKPRYKYNLFLSY